VISWDIGLTFALEFKEIDRTCTHSWALQCKQHSWLDAGIFNQLTLAYLPLLLLALPHAIHHHVAIVGVSANFGR
jgi:hypothetical protein